MAGIQTSRITTDSGDDLTIQPAAGKKTLLKSVTSDNPGATPLVTKSDGEVKKLDVSQLEDIGGLAEDDDWLMVHDVSDGNKIKKIKAGELLGGGSHTLPQPPFPDPLPANGLWVDEDSILAVQAGGSGSTADLQNSVEFAVADQTFNQSDKNVTLGQTVYVRWVDSKLNSATHGQTISGTLYAKSGSSFTQTWNLTIIKQPTAGWDLVDVFDQPVSTQITSALAIPTGMNAPSPVTIDGGTLTSIEVSVNGGAFTSTPGNIESGQTIAVRGTTGASNSTGYTALVSIGGLQRTWTATTVAAVASIAQPSITSPVNGANNLGPGEIKITSSDYLALNGAGAQVGPSDWEVYEADAGASTPSGTPGAGYTLIVPSDVKKVKATLDSSQISANKDYFARVKYNDGSVYSAWSEYSKFSTSATFGPPDIGEEFGGGYYAGIIDVNAAGVGTHYLIVASKNKGQKTSKVEYVKFGKEKPANALGYDVYGKTPTDNFNDTKAPANYFVVNDANGPRQNTLGGYDDWYTPARYELEIVYYNLKPGPFDGGANSGRYGGNNYSVPKRANQIYTRTDPPITSAPLFKDGGAEAFNGSGTDSNWTSSSKDEDYQWTQTFGYGSTLAYGNLDKQTIRAIRRIPI